MSVPRKVSSEMFCQNYGRKCRWEVPIPLQSARESPWNEHQQHRTNMSISKLKFSGRNKQLLQYMYCGAKILWKWWKKEQINPKNEFSLTQSLRYGTRKLNRMLPWLDFQRREPSNKTKKENQQLEILSPHKLMQIGRCLEHVFQAKNFTKTLNISILAEARTQKERERLEIRCARVAKSLRTEKTPKISPKAFHSATRKRFEIKKSRNKKKTCSLDPGSNKYSLDPTRFLGIY